MQRHGMLNCNTLQAAGRSALAAEFAQSYRRHQPTRTAIGLQLARSRTRACNKNMDVRNYENPASKSHRF